MYEEYPSIPAVAILKEAETDATLAEEKKNLGTADFASEHFTCGPCFVDDERTFWDELGNNIIDFKLGRLFRNPLGVWRDLKAVGERLKEKGDIQGNLVCRLARRLVTVPEWLLTFAITARRLARA